MAGSGSALQPTMPVEEPGEGELVVLIWEPNGATRQLKVATANHLGVGRTGSGTNVELDDPAVSRRHAVLRFEDAVELEDLGSSNGTFLGGRRLIAGEPCSVRLGDPIVLGGSMLIIRRGDVPTDTPTDPLVAPSVRGIISKVVGTDSSLLLYGETGVGKSELARWIHHRSGSSGPLVEVHARGREAGELSDELLETGGGALVRAVSGTLVIDDLTEIPLPLQDSLVRALDQGPQVRIVATSRLAPPDAVRLGVLRKDLRYRLGAVAIHIPALREHPEDLRAAVEAALASHANRVTVSEEGRRFLASLPWHGNRRELATVLHAAASSARSGGELTVDDLAMWCGDRDNKEATERDRVVEALAACAGNQSKAAQLLGISRGTLVARIRKYGLARPRKR